MGPKPKFFKQQIIDAAFEIARTEGIDNVTVKKVADKIGSSVAPIYVNFKDASELIDALIGKIIDVSRQILREESTGNPFNDIGRASLRFAREYSVLFRDLVTRGNDYLKGYDEKMIPVLIEDMKNDPHLEGFSTDELHTILLKMRIFQIGLSVMVANGLLPENLEHEDLVKLLSSAANDVIVSARQSKGQSRQ